jgi:hypothetical protein
VVPDEIADEQEGGDRHQEETEPAQALLTGVLPGPADICGSGGQEAVLAQRHGCRRRFALYRVGVFVRRVHELVLSVISPKGRRFRHSLPASRATNWCLTDLSFALAPPWSWRYNSVRW